VDGKNRKNIIMKKILTGLSNNVFLNKQKIKVWAESFKKHSDGEVILIAANANIDDINTCNELGIKYHLVTLEDTYHINHKRLEHTRDFLKISDGELFLITDVFDVVFQSDPFEKFDLDTYDLFFTSEGILVSEEPWNADVIIKVFGDEIDLCRNSEIICSGVIGGKKEQLIDLYDKMFLKCESGTDKHNIKDQAALILLLEQKQIQNYKILTLNDGWAMHCATSGPTEFFIPWGMKNTIEKRYNVPTMINNKVCTNDGRVFNIVHQFNRVPEWKEILTKEYE
jgi:hypothetical protein